MFDHVPGLLVDLLRLTVWLAIFSVIFVPLERLFPVHPQKVFRKQIGADLGYYFLIGLTAGLVLAAPLAVIAYTARHLVPIAVLTTTATWPIWMRASAAMVVGEIGYYWGHRLSHEVPFLWRFHAIHHSAEQIDFLVSTRAHPVDFVFTRICMLAPLYALGLVGTVHATDGAIAMGVILARSSCGDIFVHADTCGGGSVPWNGSSRRQVSTTGTTHTGCSAIATMHPCCRGSIAFLARITCRRFGRRVMEFLNLRQPLSPGSSFSRSRSSAPRPRPSM